MRSRRCHRSCRNTAAATPSPPLSSSFRVFQLSATVTYRSFSTHPTHAALPRRANNFLFPKEFTELSYKILPRGGRIDLPLVGGGREEDSSPSASFPSFFLSFFFFLFFIFPLTGEEKRFFFSHDRSFINRDDSFDIERRGGGRRNVIHAQRELLAIYSCH